jgi:DNA-binding protein H-NS
MTSYLELRAKGEKLLAEAEELRVKEVHDVILDIKQKIKAYGLTSRDLGLTGASGSGGKKKVAPVPKTKSKVRFRGPNGETWSGGRGRKPRWVTEALAKGRKIEEFAV